MGFAIFPIPINIYQGSAKYLPTIYLIKHANDEALLLSAVTDKTVFFFFKRT